MSKLVTRFIVSVSLLLSAQFAWAHTALKQATPAPDAVVAAVPTKIDLVFSESVKLVKLQIMASDHEMPSSFAPNDTAQAEFSFETPGMHPGTFTVNWSVLGADGHPVNNSYKFTVDQAAAGSAAN